MGIYNNIDTLIKESMKNKELDKVNVLRLIKAEIVKKIKDGFEYSEVLEGNVLNKMISQREDSIEQFSKANRIDLVEKENRELEIIKTFAPKQISDEEIISVTEKIISDYETVSMKDMKTILSKVQEVYPTANGKLVSQVLKKHI